MKGYSRCRRAQLSLARFNLSFSGTVFALKLVVMVASIFGFTFSIKFMTKQPLLGGISTHYGIEGVLMFTTLYNDLFRIPAYVEQIKSSLRVSANKLANPRHTKHVKLLANSIPYVGVKVGSFRFFEREATLIFIDFIANQVMSLLIGLESK